MLFLLSASIPPFLLYAVFHHPLPSSILLFFSSYLYAVFFSLLLPLALCDPWPFFLPHSSRFLYAPSLYPHISFPITQLSFFVCPLYVLQYIFPLPLTTLFSALCPATTLLLPPSLFTWFLLFIVYDCPSFYCRLSTLSITRKECYKRLGSNTTHTTLQTSPRPSHNGLKLSTWNSTPPLSPAMWGAAIRAMSSVCATDGSQVAIKSCPLSIRGFSPRWACVGWMEEQLGYDRPHWWS